MPRILIISHDVVGSRMAGPGIRAWHLACALAPSGAVTLVAPRPIDLADLAFACGEYAWGNAASLATRSARPMGGGEWLVLAAHPELGALPAAARARPVADPVLLENLEHMRAAWPSSAPRAPMPTGCSRCSSRPAISSCAPPSASATCTSAR
ncbi:MAG: hypothetical protein U0Z44_07080 [Kouleothrix sp.]